jgi:tetratricopeptide (TPR) repeat protein
MKSQCLIIFLFAWLLSNAALAQVNYSAEELAAAVALVEKVLGSPKPETKHDPKPEPEIDYEAIRVEAQADRARYEQVISDLELTSVGSYNPSLTEAYLNLAGTLERLDLYEEAAAVYDQALQSIRINNGLNSMEQLPVLEELQENSIAIQDWEKVDRFSNLAFHITRRNFSLGDERRVKALDDLGQWKLRAVRDELTDKHLQFVQDTIVMYSSERELLEAIPDYEQKSIHLAVLHLGEARAKLAIAQDVLDRPLGDFGTSGQQTYTTQVCRMVILPNGKIIQECEAVEMPNMDYYLDPSMRKSQEISRNLLDIRRSIGNAYKELQKHEDLNERNPLLEEVQVLTNAYNSFITENAL